MATTRRPARYRASGLMVVDTKLGRAGKPIIRADNLAHCAAIARALNAYEFGVVALRRVVAISEPGSDCYVVANEALNMIEQVINC